MLDAFIATYKVLGIPGRKQIKNRIMKVLVDVTDNKGDFILELLNSFSFAKAKPISPAKAQLLEDIKEAVENLNLVKQGKLKARPAKDLLNEL